MKILLLTIVVGIVSFASPAFKGEIEFKQADGSVFKGKLKGDEYFSWIEDNENIIIFNIDSKNFEYGELKEEEGELNLVPSGIKVRTNFEKKSSETIENFQKVSRIKIDKVKLYELWEKKSKKALEKRKHMIEEK